MTRPLQGWMCSKCGTFHETKTATCSTCNPPESERREPTRRPIGCPRCWAICRLPCGEETCPYKPS